MNVSIDMPEFAIDRESPVIDSMLRKLLVRETLDGENKWFCEKCNEKVAAAKFITFQSLAPALVIQLKRFRYDPVSFIIFIFTFKLFIFIFNVIT